MNAEYIGLALVVTAIIGWAVWHFGWRKLALEELRQALFAIRDRLFIEAASKESGLSLENPAYRAVRFQINSTIRFCHRLSWVMILLPALTPARKYVRDFKSPAQIEIDALPDGETKKRLNSVRTAIALEIVKYLLKTSPPFLLVSVVAGVVLALSLVVHRQLRSFRVAFAERAEEELRPISAYAVATA